MARTAALFNWVDEVLDGKLLAELRRLRREGHTIDQIARYLADRDVEVSRETVRRWMLEHGIT